MLRVKSAQTPSLRGFLVRVAAPSQAALFLTPLLVNIAGRGVRIKELEKGLWSLEVWLPARRWYPRAVARLRDACRRLAKYYSNPAPPTFHWTDLELHGRLEKGERRFFRPFPTTERLWVTPRGENLRAQDGQEILEIEIGKAFGTGIHPATRCCLRLLQQIVDQEVPKSALDVGTGTGILAMAAARFGVGRILALDTDTHAVGVARRNVRLNALQGRIKIQCRDIMREGGSYPLVMAHLSHRTIARRAEPIIRCIAPGGLLVLGGIWRNRRDDILAHFLPQLRVIDEDHEAWWMAFLLGRA